MTTIEAVSAFRALRAATTQPPRLPTVASMTAATEAVRAAARARPDLNQGRWQLTVSPGAMKLGRYTPPGANAGEFDWYRGTMSDVTLEQQRRDRAKRSTIKSLSPESRRRMSYVLKTFDYTPLFENHGIPALVTLTMPKNWEQVAPSPKEFRAIFNNFRKRYEYAWGHPMTGVWKLEFQLRGAPHMHILMTPPSHRRPGTGETFTSWLAVNWAQVCQLPGMDWNDEEQRRMRTDHEMMGTHIDYSRGLQGADIGTVAAYFSKHGLFGAKDYQNEMPELWKEAVKTTGGIRFWGYWVLKKATGVIELNPITPHYVNR